MLKKALVVVVTSFTLIHSFAADLFPDGVLRDIKAGEFIKPAETIGGYPIFQNDGNWKFQTGKAYTSSGGAAPVKMGFVQLDYYSSAYLLARQLIAVNTENGSAPSWGGSPCSPGHLVVRDKGRGRQDNCMTIDAQAVTTGTTATTFLNITLTNSGGSGRYYRIILSINADLLGVRGSSTADWTEDELRAKPFKKAAIEKLSTWAEQIQDGSIKAFDFSKPQDAYANIPSLMTLLSVPDDLIGQKFSISFVTAVEHLRHIETIKSIAYARYEDYKGAWGFVTDQPTQEAADAAAIAKCESIRTVNRPDVPACKVYRITEGRRAADTYDFEQVSKRP